MKHQTGQIGLVVLLIAAVLLTVGIGVASESVQVQKTTRQETESSETFSAAEDAAEWALGQDLSSADLSNYPGSWADGTVQLSSGNRNSYSGQILEGQSGQVDLTGVTSDTITVQWQAGNDCTTSSSIIVTTLGVSGLTRNAYGCARGDGFTLVPSSGGYYTADVPMISGQSIARIKAVYGPAQVTVSGLAVPQQYTVTATAEKDSGETRAVQVTKDLPAVPWIFDYALFSGNGDIAVTSP